MNYVRILPLFASLIVAGCDAIPAFASPEALVRQGNARACSHPKALELVDRAIRGGFERAVNDEELRAIPISFDTIAMTSVEDGVKVFCEARVLLPRGFTAPFAYELLPSSDEPGELLIRWNDQRENGQAGGLYSIMVARWQRTNSEQTAASSRPASLARSIEAPAPAAQNTSSPRQSPTDEELIFQSGGIKIFSSYDDGVVCVGCGGSTDRRSLDLGFSRLEGSAPNYVLLTPDTGNLAGGGTTYAVNLTTLNQTDLHTYSEGDPRFAFEDRTDGFYVVATLDGRSRDFLLEPKN